MRYRETGILLHDRANATWGYTLIAPLATKTIYVMGMNGECVNEWHLPMIPCSATYLLPGGRLFWAGKCDEGPAFPGRGGLFREYSWDGKILWEYQDPLHHHDFRRLPNGNTIYIGWEAMTPEEMKRVGGGVPGTEKPEGIYSDFLKEVTPEGKVVWEWHAKTDMEIEKYPLCPCCDRTIYAHANSCAPLPNGDILVGFRRINLLAVIDRKTRRFNWEMRDDLWGHQHDADVLPNGNFTLFANGDHVRTQHYGRAVEIDPKTKKTVWQYMGKPYWTLDSWNLCGVQRLWSGNTLICEGQPGRVFEVTPGKDIVWEYVSPFSGEFFGINGGPSNSLFRAYRYRHDSPELKGFVPPPSQ